MVLLKEIAYARSGDKGIHANVALIARNAKDYLMLKNLLTPEKIKDFFREVGVQEVIRYEIDHLHAMNFMLLSALDGGASRSLRCDAQGKAFGSLLLEMEID